MANDQVCNAEAKTNHHIFMRERKQSTFNNEKAKPITNS